MRAVGVAGRRRLPPRLSSSWGAPLDLLASAQQRKPARHASRPDALSGLLWAGYVIVATHAPAHRRSIRLALTAGSERQARKREARRQSGEVCEHGIWKCR